MASTSKMPSPNVKSKTSANLKGDSLFGKRFVPKPSLTDEQKRDLKNAFGEFDPRGVGVIDSRNFIVSLRAMGFEPKCASVAKFIQQEIGPREKDVLDFKDYYQLMSTKMLEDDGKAEVSLMYLSMCDEERGVITLDNLVKIAEELEENISIEKLQEMISFANSSDKKGPGVATEPEKDHVTFEEFVKMMECPELE